jgi:hypothetical protein
MLDINLSKVLLIYSPLVSIPLAILYLLKIDTWLGKCLTAGPTVIVYGLILAPIYIGCELAGVLPSKTCGEAGYLFLLGPVVLIWSLIMIIPFVGELRDKDKSRSDI